MAIYEHDRAPARDSLATSLHGTRNTIIGAIVAAALLISGVAWFFSAGGVQQSSVRDAARATTPADSVPVVPKHE